MRLFVYGVLIRELAQGRAAQLIAPLGPGSRATTNGTLYGVGNAQSGFYPILLPDRAGPLVHGAVHDAAGVDWAGLDAFEDAHDGPEAEYHRRELVVRLPEGIETGAQAYCFARRVPDDAVLIPHGDFGRWLRETGRSAISDR